MRLNILLMTALLGGWMTGTVNAQNLKIGYANMELILVYMPETKTMNQQLQTFQTKLGQALQVKQEYLRGKYQEYAELEQTPNIAEDQLKAKQEEILKLEREVQQATQDSEDKLLSRRQELMAPIVEKLQKEINTIATEEGYTYIFNTVDGSGVSILLKGPEEHDLTRKIMTRLGIQIPEETPAGTPAATGNN